MKKELSDLINKELEDAERRGAKKFIDAVQETFEMLGMKDQWVVIEKLFNRYTQVNYKQEGS